MFTDLVRGAWRGGLNTIHRYLNRNRLQKREFYQMPAAPPLGSIAKPILFTLGVGVGSFGIAEYFMYNSPVSNWLRDNIFKKNGLLHSAESPANKACVTLLHSPNT